MFLQEQIPDQVSRRKLHKKNLRVYDVLIINGFYL